MNTKRLMSLLTIFLSLGFLFGCNTAEEQDPAPPEVETPGMDEEEPDLDEEPSEEGNEAPGMDEEEPDLDEEPSEENN
ncbi:hypothetical protein [Metabacillus sp. B2-18]|uniref:hypothetical protein n=1 Tax=Metabacillus sp. B2-18 TaxID=2897333 RepID=UPI001E4BF68C|nr:hypothetical protein [Metabacillus sp. B2-18]UGB30359.1 hypothetical protein LPC09_22090 [Metabacillus sp. B2-18]